MNLSITVIIIIINCIVSYIAINKHELMNKLILTPYWIEQRNEYYRFITSGFIHKDYLHLVFNMFSLYFFGEIIEFYLGTFLYITLYIAALIISSIPTYLKYKNNSRYASLGASGAVSAVIFASILFHPVEDICIYVILCIPAFIFGAIYLYYSYYMDKRDADHINHSAHFYGAVVGFVFVSMLYPQLVPEMLLKILHWRPAFMM